MLRQMPAESVDMVVTSPPYWALRDYKLPPSVWGGDPNHAHEWGVLHVRGTDANVGFNERWGRATGERKQERTQDQSIRQGRFCGCGAWLGQLGLEPTPQLFVEHLVDVFREVRRVLAPHGTVWLNLGDSYVARGKGSMNGQERSGLTSTRTQENAPAGIDKTGSGLKPKDLTMVPARTAIALQDDGWWVRSEVIWSKPNPMPESVTDRPSRSHETLFMLTKTDSYYFDQEAVREPHKHDGRKVTTRTVGAASHSNYQEFGHEEGRERWPNGGRNLRSVWEIPTQAFSAAWLGLDDEDHFATFPEDLATRCIEASAPRWVCVRCGSPRYRIVQRLGGPQGDHTRLEDEQDGSDAATRETGHAHRAGGSLLSSRYKEHGYAEMRTLGWTECPCQIGLPGDSFTEILTPLGDGDGTVDPSMEVGRGGMARPRNEDEGVWVTTRYEQRAYAEQLRRLSRDAPGWFCQYDQAVGEEAMAHYMRTDAAGARAIPPALLEEMIADGPLKRVELPVVPPGEYRPGRVLDMFMGSGTTAAVSRRLNREVWGVEQSERYVKIAALRAEKFWAKPRPSRRQGADQMSLLGDEVSPAAVAD